MNDQASYQTLERRLAIAEAALAEAREREAELSIRESRSRRLFASLDDGMAVVETVDNGRGQIVDMVFREVNAAFARQRGICDVVGRSMIEMLPGVEDIWLERCRHVARTGETLRLEDHLQDVDAWFDICFTRVDSNGRHVAVVSKDISERKRADALLRESEARQRLLIGAWAQAVWETNASGVVEKDGPSWRAYTGQTVDEWLGYGWLNAIHPDDREYAGRQWREAISVRGPVDAEFRLRSPDGEWRWTNVRAAPVLDAEGRIQKWAGMNIDIDARKRADVALRASEERYRSLFETMDEGYLLGEVLFDDSKKAIDVRFVEANPAAVRLAGRDFSGRRMREIDPNHEESWYDSYGQVALTGRPLRLQRYAKPHGRWFDVRISSVDRDGSLVACLFQDITERKLAEESRAVREEQQAFLLELSDALRSVADAAAMREIACRMIGSHLRVARAYYVEYDAEADVGVVSHDYVDAGLPSLAGRYPFEAFRTTYERIGKGATWTMSDVDSDLEPAVEERDVFREQGVVSWVNVPLVKDGRFRAALCVVGTTARCWQPHEISLVEEVADRLWASVERMRPERISRESESRFRQFASSSSGALWIRNAATMDMEYASPAIQTIYGVAPEAILGDVRRWAEHIVPEDRQISLAYLSDVGDGGFVVHEFRILRVSDGAFRWIRNTVFPLLDDQGRVERIGGVFEDVTDAKQATEHRNVLLFELQHRVRNILAIVRSIAQRTSHTAGSVAEYRDRLEGRLRALAHVQVLLTRSANAGVDLATLVRDEVEAQAEHASQVLLSGPELVLSAKAAEVLTLAVHELTTNAVKYGALADTVGGLSVTWRVAYEADEPWLRLDWCEKKGVGLLSPPARRGLGTELIEDRIPYELDGRGNFSFRPEGVAWHLTFPLRRGASILATDAATLNTMIRGGALDMAGEVDLQGCCVLVAEDDYYLASDTARALRMAGADVLGPVGNDEQALILIAERRVTCALVDINLGDGLSFGVADALWARGVPFVFVTGYDDAMIPERFSDVPRMRKPTDFRDVVRAAAKICRMSDR